MDRRIPFRPRRLLGHRSMLRPSGQKLIKTDEIICTKTQITYLLVFTDGGCNLLGGRSAEFLATLGFDTGAGDGGGCSERPKTIHHEASQFKINDKR